VSAVPGKMIYPAGNTTHPVEKVHLAQSNTSGFFWANKVP